MATEHTFLWLLKNPNKIYYDNYDSCVVAAISKEAAIQISPSLFDKKFGRGSGWVSKPEDVIVEKIGVTQKHREGKVIVSSYNAG